MKLARQQTFTTAGGRHFVVFDPPRVHVHQWLWWFIAHRMSFLFELVGKRRPSCGILDINGKRVRVVELLRPGRDGYFQTWG